ncbi:MAG: hypothetical protein ACE5I9_11585 [Candidatus Methylomirabilales bacterium]
MALDLNYPRVKIYQDGLPLCGREEEIVRVIAGRGGLNHQLILDLIEKGAVLVGTESGELILEEYDQLRRLSRVRDPDERSEIYREAEGLRRQLLLKRDEFIAGRIDKTLQEEETGILFIGLLHDVTKSLPADIDVSFLADLSASG